VGRLYNGVDEVADPGDGMVGVGLAGIQPCNDGVW
jgi:hypothetical protein